MKVTQAMIDAFRAAPIPHGWKGDELLTANLQAVLDLIEQDRPDVEPFTFTGHPNLYVYLHPACGTVVDADPVHAGVEGSVYQQVQDGECDCENTSPWKRIYVERAA